MSLKGSLILIPSILLDEVQLVPEFEDVLNSFLHIKNTDTYVTGSNAKFLSKDIITEFRGRGDQVHLYPLSFAEFMSIFPGDKHDGWQQYITFGGLPKIQDMENDADKMNYLRNIFEETYIRDILERHDVRNQSEMEELLDIVASNIGGLIGTVFYILAALPFTAFLKTLLPACKSRWGRKSAADKLREEGNALSY